MSDASGSVIWHNQRWYEYTGAAPEQNVRWNSPEVHDPRIFPKVLDLQKQTLETGSPFEMEFPLRGRDGAFRWFLTRIIPSHDDDGRILQWFGTATDVTELKRMRDEHEFLLKREQEARTTAELLNRVGPTLLRQLQPDRLMQSVVDMAAALIGAETGSFFRNVADESGIRYTLHNCTGAPAEDFVDFSATFEIHSVVRVDDITRAPAKHQQYPGMPGGRAIRSYLAAPVMARSGDLMGELFFGNTRPGWFTEQHASIVTGIAAQTAIAMDNARLFEESQWVQNELKRSNEELRRANGDLETFAWSASHDLQEPLRNIAISAQLLERAEGARLGAEARGFLDDVLQGAVRMRELIEDLLAYTQATKFAKGPLPRVNAASVLDRVKENLRKCMENSGATIVAGELPWVCIHEIHLEQLFQNLIGNALKYRGKEPPLVRVSGKREQGWWVISVADNGIGIEPQYLDQIFGLFKRLHTRRQYSGSGIGLAICKRIVEQYGGRIWVESSAPGAGSVFCFAVPDR